MSTRTNHQILLKSRPAGLPEIGNFELAQKPVREPGEGEVLLRTIYLSLDPYMRGRMSDAKSYAASTPLGAVMGGATVSQVVQSRVAGFEEGDIVLGYDGWQEYGISSGQELHKIDPSQAPISYYLGVLGMPGMTAYVGLLDIGQPQIGETVVVSAASGAVGSVVGQIARIKGCRAVGIAGSDAKCAYVVEELGFDGCVNYKHADLPGELRNACPDGIDIDYENVGGKVMEAVLPQINRGARVVLVGLISQYNAEQLPPGPNLGPILINRAKIQGMIVGDHMDRVNDFRRDVSQWLREDRIKYKEDIVQGLQNAPQAFLGLFEGKNFGKLIVQVSQDPTKR